MRFITSETTDKQIKDIEAWLESLPFGGLEAAIRFGETLARELVALCADIAERLASGSNLPTIDEEASLAFSRPAYKHLFTTAASGKRKRGQNAGVYLVFYELLDFNTLQVIGLRHGAAEPLTAYLDRNGSGEQET